MLSTWIDNEQRFIVFGLVVKDITNVEVHEYRSSYEKRSWLSCRSYLEKIETIFPLQSTKDAGFKNKITHTSNKNS
jgi:hypothetical protein